MAANTYLPNFGGNFYPNMPYPAGNPQGPGGNPMQVLGSMGGNPQIAQFMKMINGKSGQQLQQMAENMARDRGIDIDELARQLGMKR